MTGEEELAVRQARGAANLARGIVGLRCTACGGTGRFEGRWSAAFCPDCGGTGIAQPMPPRPCTWGDDAWHRAMSRLARLDGNHDDFRRLLAEEREHSRQQWWPESVCQICGGPNVIWYAPNELWNAVMGSEAGIVCPTCFVARANEVGIRAAFFVDCPAHKEEDQP